MTLLIASSNILTRALSILFRSIARVLLHLTDYALTALSLVTTIRFDDGFRHVILTFMLTKFL